jgi:predicted RNase H-like nuclease
MQYIGIDLAWSPHNPSGVALLEDNKVLISDIMTGVDEIVKFINCYPNAKVGIDAPLLVNNQTGNRIIEKEFLKDYGSKKLGVYPVNRELLTKNHSIIVGEEICKQIPQTLGQNLFEVYPHVTIMNCFHGAVLPYKRKKGRNTAFIKEQLKILQTYISENLDGDFYQDIDCLKGKALKLHEDRLDAIICAYTLLYCKSNPFKVYENIFKVPV